MQWQIKDFKHMKSLKEEEIANKPNRASLALILAVSHLQANDTNEASYYVGLAKKWGATNELTLRILMADAYIGLGGLEFLLGNEEAASKFFETSKKLDENRFISEVIDRDDVIKAYLYLLGRKPESEEVIKSHLKLEKYEQLRERIINSAEYNSRFREHKKNKKRQTLNLDKPRIIFMHLPKTGGTTVHSLLRKCFDDSEICKERWNNLWDCSLNELAIYSFFSGHFDYEACKRIPGRNNRIITMFREPKKRLISLYYFERAHTKAIIEREGLWLAELANRYSIGEFFSIPEVRNHSSINNAMVNSLIGNIKQGRWEREEKISDKKAVTGMNDEDKISLAKKNISSMSAYGIMENFDSSVLHILDVLGLKKPKKIPVENSLSKAMHSNPDLKTVEKMNEPKDFSEIIEGLVHLDMKLYEDVVDVLKKDQYQN